MSMTGPAFEYQPLEGVAGIESITCECGWEVVYVTPEENELMLGSLLRHLRKHGAYQPQLTVMTH